MHGPWEPSAGCLFLPPSWGTLSDTSVDPGRTCANGHRFGSLPHSFVTWYCQSKQADKRSQGTWTHAHPIGLKEAQELSLPARGDMPAEFYQLMALFPQPMQRQPTVPYIPAPYGPPPSPGGKNP